MQKISYLKLFLIFIKIGAILLGGGYVILPILTHEFYEKRKLIDKEDLINLCKKISENNEVFIIGGASLYSMFIDIADVLYITHIEKVEETADVYFPKIDEAKWKKNILANDEDNNIKFSWVEYTKI